MDLNYQCVKTAKKKNGVPGKNAYRKTKTESKMYNIMPFLF